jgi:hypothetical protein
MTRDKRMLINMFWESLFRLADVAVPLYFLIDDKAPNTKTILKKKASFF